MLARPHKVSNNLSSSPNERRDNAMRGISLTDAAAVVDCGVCNIISDLVITSKPVGSFVSGCFFVIPTQYLLIGG